MSQARSVVLLVEDDHLILLHSTMILEDAGYEVLPAPDAETALASLAERDDIDALLTDIDLPGELNGVTLAHSVRAARPDMSIVLTSGKHMLDDETLPEGGRFMAKPYTAAQMRMVLGR